MNSLGLDTLEIVGFNATTLGVCGRSIPVVKNKVTDTYFLFLKQSIEADNLSYFSKEEIELFQNEGRLTLIQKPIPAFHDAVILYVNKQLLNTVSYDLRTQLVNHKPIYIQALNQEFDLICAPGHLVETLMNEWGMYLIEKITVSLVEFMRKQKEQPLDTERCIKTIEEYISMGLYAARSPILRARIYLRYGCILTLSNIPEKLENLYKVSIMVEFPSWDWNGFQKRIEVLVDILKFKVSLSDRIRTEYNVSQINKLSQGFMPPQESLSNLIGKMRQQSQLELTDEEMEILVSADGDTLLSPNTVRESMINNKPRHILNVMSLIQNIKQRLSRNENLSAFERELMQAS